MQSILVDDHHFKRIDFEDLKTSLIKYGMTHRKTAGGEVGISPFRVEKPRRCAIDL